MYMVRMYLHILFTCMDHMNTIAQQDCILSREECERLHDIDGKLIAVQDSINSLDTCMQVSMCAIYMCSVIDN